MRLLAEKLMIPCKVLLSTVLALGVALAVPHAHAQTDYPTRPVKLVVPYPAGGFSDAVARLLVPTLTRAWNQPVVVENRGGANGILGTAAVSKAPPDGYTLLVAIDSHVSNHILTKTLPYETVKDFAPIALLGSAPMVMIANPSFPPSNVADLISVVNAKPESVSYGSLGAGSQIHLTMRLLENSAGIRMQAVPYKGGGPAFTDLMAGHIHLMFASATSATPLIRGGKVKALGVASPIRLPTLPDVPTMGEQGHPSVEMGVWLGFMAPAGTPEPVVRKIRETLAAAVAQPEVAKRLADMGIQMNLKGPAEFGDFIRNEIGRWGDMIRRENIKPTD